MPDSAPSSGWIVWLWTCRELGSSSMCSAGPRPNRICNICVQLGSDAVVTENNESNATHGIDFRNLRHVGVVVTNLDEAMADLSAVAGVVWDPVGEHGVRYVKSRPPAPHFELVEAREGTLWDGAWLGVQHVSIWVPDLPTAADHLEREGAVRVTGPPEQRPSSGSVYYRLRSGMLLEISTLTHP